MRDAQTGFARAIVILAALAGLMLAGGVAAQDNAAAKSAVILKLDGPVTPANADYLAREIGLASAAKKELIVIEIDTPGGLGGPLYHVCGAYLRHGAQYQYRRGDANRAWRCAQRRKPVRKGKTSRARAGRRQEIG